MAGTGIDKGDPDPHRNRSGGCIDGADLEIARPIPLRPLLIVEARVGLYTHPILGEEIRAAGGHYVIAAEKRLPFHGREVLVATGYALLDSSCCGPGGCGFALVPGYLVRWKHSRDLQGRLISETEPVREEQEKAVLRKLILASEGVQQVNFW